MAFDGAAFARWWADRYTRGLPADVRDRRRAEIASDVHEQTCAGGHASSARAIAWRTVRGIRADVAWRREEQRVRAVPGSRPVRTSLRTTWAVATQNWFAPFAVCIAAFDVLAAIAVATEDSGKMPGKAIGPVFLVAFAVSMVVGLWLRWRTGDPAVRARHLRVDRPTRSRKQVAVCSAIIVLSFGVLTVGVSAGAVPVFFVAGVLIIAATVLLGGRAVVRGVRSSDARDRSGLADGMIVAGTLPAFALFWMIIPPVLALVVIGGLLGTSPRRSAVR